jgi:NTE family protein
MKLRASHFKKLIILLFLMIGNTVFAQNQKVGLVLSGGGATGFAHIGVIKALEERGIPIHFITGTSAGALVGSMYSIGYSPAEMEAYVLSEQFQLMALGKLERKYEFLFNKDDYDASLIEMGFSQNSILKNSLPTNFITPTYLDYEMLRELGRTSASFGGNFDSLFVPFRCVAADITNKKPVIFANGHLNQAVRASMTFPFFVNPIRVNGKLLFDGGLYNNFPADVMYSEFNPDFIIGSNVSGPVSPPTEEDILSQVKNMMVYQSNFNLPCEYGFMIEPQTTVSTFDFNEVKTAIENGYLTALAVLDTIQWNYDGFISPEEVKLKREEFRKKTLPLRISSINTTNSKGYDVGFVRKSILKNNKEKIINFDRFTKRYFRASTLEQVGYLYPTLHLKKDSTFHMDIDVRKAKEFNVEIGGHFSSRPVNIGYVALSYRHLGKIATKIKAESYFGRFYGSAKLKLDIQPALSYPVKISPYFVMNRWDFFRSAATFFEDVKPSFLLQNEMYYGTELKHPIGNNSVSIFDFRKFELTDEYYQTLNFLSTDTADVTRFLGETFSWQIEQNSLNRKQFASSGHYFSFKARVVQGKERSISGSTSSTKYDLSKFHTWVNFNAEFQTFLVNTSPFHFGIYGKAVFNSQSLFSNYTATLLSMTAFSPLPDMETFFLPEYRAPQHLGVGGNMIFTVKKAWELRLDAFAYQPFKIVIENSDKTITYSDFLPNRSYIASGSAIFHSPFGPLRFTANYFPQQKNTISLQFSMGYLLFNQRAIR